jgi:hypothetical protein
MQWVLNKSSLSCRARPASTTLNPLCLLDRHKDPVPAPGNSGTRDPFFPTSNFVLPASPAAKDQELHTPEPSRSSTAYGCMAKNKTKQKQLKDHLVSEPWRSVSDRGAGLGWRGRLMWHIEALQGTGVSCSCLCGVQGHSGLPASQSCN